MRLLETGISAKNCVPLALVQLRGHRVDMHKWHCVHAVLGVGALLPADPCAPWDCGTLIAAPMCGRTSPSVRFKASTRCRSHAHAVHAVSVVSCIVHTLEPRPGIKLASSPRSTAAVVVIMRPSALKHACARRLRAATSPCSHATSACSTSGRELGAAQAFGLSGHYKGQGLHWRRRPDAPSAGSGPYDNPALYTADDAVGCCCVRAVHACVQACMQP